MDRREALKRTALMVGGVLSAPTIAGILNGCQAKPTIDWKPQFLTEEQGILVSQVCGIIIPKTHTPGAKEVGVPGFVDIMLKDVYPTEERDKFIKELEAFSKEAEQEHGDPFIELSEEDQTAFVLKNHEAALRTDRKERPFILHLKELTVAGFFTSKVGATEVLQYEAVPGAYKGCLPLSQVGKGKTWAT
jgi:gluconate 2-dehydrogenase gamma chain